MHILSESKLVLTPAMMFARSIRQKREMPRSPGVHVQAVNRRLGVAAGKISDSDAWDFPFDKLTKDYYPPMLALGVAWEELAASLYSESELFWQPGEFCRDEIYGTPDGILPSYLRSSRARLWECKETTKKAQSIRECWMYLKQGMSYCAMTECDIVTVQYDICWLLGDYTRPYQPAATRSVVQFEEKELETWWSVVLKEAKNTPAE